MEDRRTITVAAHGLTTGGSLLTVDGRRRVAVRESVAQVERALTADGAQGFLGELGGLVRGVGAAVAQERARVRRLVVRCDPEVAADPVGPLVAALAASFPGLDEGPDAPLRAGDVVVSLYAELDLARLCALEDEVAAAGARWAPFWFDGAGARFGPVREDGTSPTVRDLAARWVAAAQQDVHGRALLRAPGRVVRSVPQSAVERAHAVGLFLLDVERWLGGARPLAWWHTVHVDPAGTLVRDPVLPLPRRGPGVPPGTSGLVPTDVVNPTVGIVRRLREVRFRTPTPPGVVFVESQTADMARLAPWAANIYNAGSSWGDPERARAGATGEAIERYCGNAIDDGALELASYDELVRRGAPALDPRELTLFSAEQYADPRFPFVPLDRGTRTHWVRAESLVDGREVLVPASLTFVNWNTGRSVFSPRTNPAMYPGIAAAPTRAHALANALEEVVERDAAMVWWWSGHRLPTSPGADAVLDRLVPVGWRERHGVDLHVVPLTHAVAVPAVAVLVDAPHAGVVTMGLAARATPEEAVEKALLEALGLVETATDMQDPDGGFWTTYQPGERSGAVRPVRADRRYLDSYRPDFRDVTDLFCQLQVQLDPRSRSVVLGRLGPPDAGVWDGLPSFGSRDAAAYVDALAAQGLEPLAVDLTTSDVAAAGWSAVRVLVPGLVPNFPTAFPPLGRGRLCRRPAELGWRAAPLRPDELWSFPMPYA
ncbi:YcaO-like family protein [Cellulomonas sp.]|uniref:YcaO-like family protein n=1 Tax=Cellulomonas sp. TaxID=40001 RepID=UPI00281189CC|nr:YcaO-like family protein [Cellulomonas sp.]